MLPKPDSFEDEARADDARGGAGQDHLDAGALAELGAHHPAVGLRDQRRGGDAGTREGALKRVEIVRHAGLHVAVDDGGGGALVLADDRPDVAGAEHRQLRREARDHRLCRMLVRGIAVRIDEGDHDAFGAEMPRLRHRGLDAGPVDRKVHGAVGAHALVDGNDAVLGDERIGTFRMEIVGVRHLEPGDLEDVHEVAGREQAEPDALALDHSVHPHRRAVGEVGDACGRDSIAVAQRRDALHDLGAGLVRGGEHLQGMELVGAFVESAEIGERPADVHTNAVSHVAAASSLPLRRAPTRPLGQPDA